MHPQSNSFILEQGLSFSDPLLCICDCFPALLLPRSETENLTRGFSHSLLRAGKLVGTCICSQVMAQMASSIGSSFIKESPPTAMLLMSWVSLPPMVVKWSGGLSSRSYLFYIFLCSLSFSFFFSFLSAPLISRKNFYFNIPRTSGSWSVGASGILLTLPRC